jgi:integrase
MATNLTDLFIRNLKPAEKEYTRREKGGLGIRVLPSGLRSFFYLFRVDGRRYTSTLGPYKDSSHPDGITLAVARADYEEKRAKVKALKAGRADGVNPVLAKKEKRLEREIQRKIHTTSELIDEYLTRHAKIFKKSWKEDERILKREVFPLWGKHKAASITKRDIILLLQGIVDRGSPVMANNVFKIIRKMFSYAVEKDILALSPADNVKMPSPIVARKRVLDENEVKVLWSTLDEASMTDEVRRALKLILVTAQRPGEVIGMHTNEIDGRWWTIPSERAKNKKPHHVYLTDTALQLIGELKVADPETGEESWKGNIFPSPRYGEGKAINRHTMSQAVNNNCPSGCVNDCAACHLNECKADSRPLEKKNSLRIAHFTPHDLRRTAATFMSGAGERDDVIDAVLNHAKKGIIKIYNRYNYDNEKQAALKNWERKLLSIIEGQQTANVISINSRRKIA